MTHLKKLPFKWILIAELVVCYMSVLSLISYIRGAMELVPSSNMPLLSTDDFQSFVGEVPPTDGTLPLGGSLNGEVSGWLASVDLAGIDGILVMFEMETTETAGEDALFVDLYNEERGYDAPEQEADFLLLEGISQHSFFLSVGKNAPPSALFRAFTFSRSVCVLSGLQVFPAKFQPRVPVSLYIGVAVCFSILAVTVAVHWIDRRRMAHKLAASGKNE